MKNAGKGMYGLGVKELKVSGLRSENEGLLEKHDEFIYLSFAWLWEGNEKRKMRLYKLKNDDNVIRIKMELNQDKY